MGIGTSFFEHFAHFHFRSHLQTLINRESHQIKLYQSQRCRQQATGTDAPNATLSCHFLLSWQLTHQSARAGVCQRQHRGQSSAGMTSAATITEGKDLGTSNPPLANHPSVYLSLCVANLQYASTFVQPCCWCVCVCVVGHWSAFVCMHACQRRQASVRCQSR